MSDRYGVLVPRPRPDRLAWAMATGMILEQSRGKVYYFPNLYDDERPARCIAYIHVSPRRTILRMRQGTTALDLPWAAAGLGWYHSPHAVLNDCTVDSHDSGCHCYFVAVPVDAGGELEMEAFEQLTHTTPARIEAPEVSLTS